MGNTPKQETECRVILIEGDPITGKTGNCMDVTDLLFETDEKGLLKTDSKGNIIPKDTKLIMQKNDAGDYQLSVVKNNAGKDDKPLYVFETALANKSMVGIARLPVVNGAIDSSELGSLKWNETFMIEVNKPFIHKYGTAELAESLEFSKYDNNSRSKEGHLEMDFYKLSKNNIKLAPIAFVIDQDKYEVKEASYGFVTEFRSEFGTEALKLLAKNGVEGALNSDSATYKALDDLAKDMTLSFNEEEAKGLIDLAKKYLEDGKITQQEETEFRVTSFRKGLTDSGIVNDSNKRKVGWVVE